MIEIKNLMKNCILTIGICVFVFGMSACKSKSITVSEINNIIMNSNDNYKILVDKKWKLFELNGVSLSVLKSQPAVEAFIMFQSNDNIVNGNSGCNNFSGTYKIDSGKALHFSGVASTRKMCIDMTVEDIMNKLFQTVDNYTLQSDTLSLNQREASLARFVRE